MRVRSLVVAGVVLLGVAAFATTSIAQSADPWIGTWKMNIAKSKFSPGPGPKSSTSVIVAADGGIKSTTDSVPSTGAATHVEVTAKFDGKDAPVKGNPNVDTQAFTKIDGHTYQVVSKKAGKVTTTSRSVISADGKTRTTTVTGTNTEGKAVNTIFVSDKA